MLYWKISVDGDERRKESRLDLLLRSWPPPINVQMDKRETDREAQCIASFESDDMGEPGTKGGLLNMKSCVQPRYHQTNGIVMKHCGAIDRGPFVYWRL